MSFHGIPGLPDEPGSWNYRHPLAAELAADDKAAGRAEESAVYRRRTRKGARR